MDMVFLIFHNTVGLIIGILLPVFTFIFLFVYWYRNGKDLSVGTITVTYKDNEAFSKLTDTEKAIVIQQKTPKNIITSILSELEHLGYLSLEKIEKESTLEDFKIRVLKNIDKKLPEYLKIYLQLLIRNGETEFLKSELTSTWKYYDYTDFYKVQESLYSGLERKKYFNDNLLKIKDKYLQLGWTLILLGALLIMIVALPYSNSLVWLFAPALGIIVSGIIALIFTPVMPKRTQKGLKALKEFLGFREFFKRVEKPKLLRNSNKSISATTRNEVKERIKAILPLSFMAAGVLLLVVSQRCNLSSKALGIGSLLFFIGMLTSIKRKNILNIK
ncbi:DUF2207 domain-containing protein [candidate division WOR-3 bacterium]|nr:DUF2207 domain-containing protein [candidate division WOR-3 bacterium]